MVRNILKDPSSLVSQIKLYVFYLLLPIFRISDRFHRRIGIIIIRTTYGYYIQDENDPFLTTPLTAMENFSKATQPGNFLVDFIPICKWNEGSTFACPNSRPCSEKRSSLDAWFWIP